jgi:ActR/RegA family two-component response regulator
MSVQDNQAASAARKCAEMLLEQKPKITDARAMFLGEIIRLVRAEQHGNKSKTARSLGIIRSTMERARARAARTSMSEGQAAAVQVLAITARVDVNNYRQAWALFDRLMAEAALEVAPRRNWQNKGITQPAHLQQAARLLGVHRNSLRRMLTAA